MVQILSTQQTLSMTDRINEAFTVIIKAFGFTLVAYLGRLGFFFAGFVI